MNPKANSVVEFRRSGADFSAHDEIRRVAQAVNQIETVIDRIMVGDRHQVRATALCRPVDIEGPGMAIPGAQEAEVLSPPRVKAAAVHVGLRQLVWLSLNHKMLY